MARGQLAQRPRLALIILVVSLLVAIAGTVLWLSLPRTCADRGCFFTAANSCSGATYSELFGNGTVVTYESSGCSITKRITGFAVDEHPAVRSYFEGKTMRCTYEKEAFPPSLLEGLSVTGCSGTLRDAMLDFEALVLLGEAT